MRLVALEAEDLEESSAVVVDEGAVVGGLQETTAEIEVEIGTSIFVQKDLNDGGMILNFL